ncbi:uncharacterized protein FIBRA_00478 [Fibroporia radiculosa]|uniref:Uncharacterized protein n=1 Tax=Fibroporia radiculosa TaxID=599839 RepID=J4GHV2_9APHY|nr:uncharacterized protein FIBRA_00478 [Fibroporia radiculosa]CCL98480.1 predicted protein [Fibroporia radiculosa]
MSFTGPIPRPARERPAESRDSLLRASILESALQLGVGSNCTVTKWMFSPVEEADEEGESAVSPSLTYASTATSDDSFQFSAPAGRPSPGAGILIVPGSSAQHVNTTGPFPTTSTEVQQRIMFDLSRSPEPRTVTPIPPSPPKANKLRKLRLPGNGNESDGGYLSDGGRAKGEKEKEKKKRAKKEKGDGNMTEYESDGGYFSESARKARKKSRQEKKARDKDAESPTTDYETDGGGRSKQQRSRKGSVMSSMADDSDGGYLSESSTKKKGFFRLNARGRKKRDGEDSQGSPIPPMPALPLTLPIAEKFLRSSTPTTISSSIRSETPLSIHPSNIERESMISMTSTERDERAGSIVSREGLTKAFRDVHSVHRPSIDALATFRNLAPAPNSPSPLKESSTNTAIHPYAQSSNDVPSSSTQASEAPKRSLTKSRDARPNISSPNTTMLAPKHVPAPLVLNSSSSIRSYVAQQYPHTPDSGYVLVTPQPGSEQGFGSATLSVPPRSPARPESDLLGLPQGISRPSSSAPPSPTTLRPHVLAYYSIPPPTPPPQGPLPEVPVSASSSRPSLSVNISPRSLRPDSADGVNIRPVPFISRIPASPAGPPPTRGLPPPPPILAATRPARSSSESDLTANAPTVSASESTMPTAAESTAKLQRDRVSPFPISPVVPKEQSPGLIRKLSNLVISSPNTTTSPKLNRTGNYPASKPSSSDGYGSRSGWYDPDRLDSQWQPRSASALDRPHYDMVSSLSVRRKVSFEDELPGEERSVLDMGDDDDDDVDQSTQPSLEDASFQYGEGADCSRMEYQSADADLEDDDRSHYEDSRPPTMYSCDGGDASSVWSHPDSRRSFFDEDKSANARARFVRQVEAVYGEYKIPPVPPLQVAKSPKNLSG